MVFCTNSLNFTFLSFLRIRKIKMLHLIFTSTAGCFCCSRGAAAPRGHATSPHPPHTTALAVPDSGQIVPKFSSMYLCINKGLRVLADNSVGLGFVLYSVPYIINTTPRKNICCGKKWPQRHLWPTRYLVFFLGMGRPWVGDFVDYYTLMYIYVLDEVCDVL